MRVEIVCPQCTHPAMMERGRVNRAASIGAPLYCGRACSGLARRKGKTKVQLVAEKKIYDADYRAKNLALLKDKKKRRHEATYDPKTAAIARRQRMHLHVAYCQRPAYREWKKEYDRKHQAKQYGEYAEAWLLLRDIDNAVNTRASDYDVRITNGTLNKKQQRRRDYESSVRI